MFLEMHTANHLSVCHMPKEQAPDEHPCTEDTLLGASRAEQLWHCTCGTGSVGSPTSRQLQEWSGLSFSLMEVEQ